MEAHCLCRITIMLDVKMQYKKRGCPMLSYFLDALFIHFKLLVLQTEA